MRFTKIPAITVLSSLTIAAMAAADVAYPPDVAAVLDSAGGNRGQLEQVIEHYRNDPDTLKLTAAYYLVGNMEGHSYVTYKLCDSTGNEVEFSVFDYPDYDSLQTASAALEQIHGTLDFKRDTLIEDCRVVTAEFLIDQIDFAFKAWREKPWAKALSFEQFCQYVLPYRGSNEPLEPWRETMWDRYASLQDRMGDSTDPIEAAALINDDVKTWFGFDPRFYYHPTDQGLSEMTANGLGRCEDMTNVTIYAMRANGIAVTSDYTPHWANTGNNHAWNAVVKPDGTVMPFMGAEANPGKYRLANKLAKVYRKTFGKQPDNLIFRDRKQEKVPGWLAGKNYVDVTADYVPVQDLAVALDRTPDSVDIAYICVFNSGEWRAMDWATIEIDTTVFTDIGRDIAYLPALYLNEKIVPAAAARILHGDGTVEILAADTSDPISVRLASTTARKQKASTDGIQQTYLTPGKEYELFYWSDGWQSVGTRTADDGPLVFDGVPGGALYWLVAEGSDHEERIFTLDQSTGEQVWW